MRGLFVTGTDTGVGKTVVSAALIAAMRAAGARPHAYLSLIHISWAARVERFGDSTDMCSLVNAKSGGCAEDCGCLLYTSRCV